MTTKTNRSPDNKLQKVIRLIKKLESELIPEGSGNYLDITFESEGNGRIMYFVGQEQTSYTIITFENEDDVLRFLEGNQLDRMLMIRESVI
jgi:hypothetical protein